jgi:hypothetical protein
LEKQGTTYIVKVYSSGAAAVAKSSATLLCTATGTVSDSAFEVGTRVSFIRNTNATLVGGLSTGDGGVYVEGWGPESITPVFSGTLGGQAFGFDEAADAGPLAKQIAMRFYIPASSRQIKFGANANDITADGSVAPSVAYTYSLYMKTSGKAGAGALITSRFNRTDSAGTFQGVSSVTDAGETSWTRKSVTATTEAGTRRANAQHFIGDGSTTTGTAFIQLVQLEQGSTATAWRNAPEDFEPIIWYLIRKGDSFTTTSTLWQEVDARNLAINAFLPWDANVVIEAEWPWYYSAAVLNNRYSQIVIDGVGYTGGLGGPRHNGNDADTRSGVTMQHRLGAYVALAAGKHRIAPNISMDGASGGILTLVSGTTYGPFLMVKAYRGKGLSPVEGN